MVWVQMKSLCIERYRLSPPSEQNAKGKNFSKFSGYCCSRLPPYLVSHRPHSQASPAFCSSVCVQYNTQKQKSVHFCALLLNANWITKTGEAWEWGYFAVPAFLLEAEWQLGTMLPFFLQNPASLYKTQPLSTTYDSMQRSEGYSSFFQFSATQSNSQKVSSHFQKTAVDEVTSSRWYKITGLMKQSGSHVWKIHTHAEDSIYGNHSCWYKYLYIHNYSVRMCTTKRWPRSQVFISSRQTGLGTRPLIRSLVPRPV